MKLLIIPLSLLMILLVVVFIGKINFHQAYWDYKISTINQEHERRIADINLEAYKQCLDIVYKYYDYTGQCEYLWDEQYNSLNQSYHSFNEEDKDYIFHLALKEPSTLEDLRLGMVMSCNKKQSDMFEEKKNECKEQYFSANPFS